MTDDLSKFNTLEFICLSTAHIWHICFTLGVFGRPEFNAASVTYETNDRIMQMTFTLDFM